MRKILIIGSEVLPLARRKSKVDFLDWDELISADTNLRDYDGVIVDISKLQTPIYIDVKNLVNPKVLYDIMKHRNSFFAVIGNPNKAFSDASMAEALGLDFSMIAGSGDSMVRPESLGVSKFESYIAKVKRYDYSFNQSVALTTEFKQAVRDRRLPSSTNNVKVLLSTKAGYAIAVENSPMNYRTVGPQNNIAENHSPFLGEFVLLPPLQEAQEQYNLLLDILDNESVTSAPPEWSTTLTVVEQEVVDAQILEKKALLDRTKNSIDKLNAKLDHIRQIIKILYATDKQLEIELKTALADAGLTVVEAKAGANKVEFYVIYRDSKFAVEVKSTSKPMFDMKGLRQVNDWRDDAWLERQEKYKPVFIGSNQVQLEPSSRSSQYLASNLIEYAETRDIACITTKQLFEELQRIKLGELGLDAFTESLMETKGLYLPIASIKAR